MERLEVSGAVRPIYGSLGVKRLTMGNLRKLMGKTVSPLEIFTKGMKH